MPGKKLYLNKSDYKTSNKQLNLNKNNKKIINKNISYSEHSKKQQQKIIKKQGINNKYKNITKINWQWPVIGKVTHNFNYKNKLNNGIDIAVNRSTAVKSAANGKVVYQGTGLKGYGKLIIIKHSDDFLSAYAHNDWLLVNEGQWIKQGEKIATIGKGKNKLLHFEIRKKGRPVDPIQYLPS